jgi:N-acetylneuraminic acid mutarotase
LHSKNIYIFGGFDGQKNHNSLYIFNTETKEWRHPEVRGEVPAGRNGHTATLVDHKMYVLGGWLGTGPFAASDMHSLNLDTLEWSVETTYGNSPGPCNMHSADLIGRDIYIFRGGDGRDYLNDLHSFNVDSKTWRYLDGEGECPPPRANHSSATYKSCLYIFGGWDGSKRLNDLFVLDTGDTHTTYLSHPFAIDKLAWTEIKVEGITPSPRAGMKLCTLQDKLYLFGGSGSSSMCFNDVHYFDTGTPQLRLRKLILRCFSVKYVGRCKLE